MGIINQFTSQFTMENSSDQKNQLPPLMLRGISKSRSESMEKNMSTVFKYLAFTGNLNTSSQKSITKLEQELEDHLKDCMRVEQTAVRARRSKMLSSPTLEGSDPATPPICYCNHMAPHRHYHIQQQSQSSNYLNSNVHPNSQLPEQSN